MLDSSKVRVNDLIDESRLERIEAQVRRENPRLPDTAKFVTFVQPASTVEHNGVERIIPECSVMGVLVPNPKWPAKQPQYRMVTAPRPLAHWNHFERQRKRIVDAPDVALMDFRAIGPKATEVYISSLEMN